MGGNSMTSYPPNLAVPRNYSAHRYVTRRTNYSFPLKSFVGGLLFKGAMIYAVVMDMLLDLRPGKWGLLILPRSMRTEILVGLGRMAERGPLLVLDGGNRFNAYIVSRAVRGRREVLERIQISRAFTCYQMVSLLEGLPETNVSVVCLDFLATFFDESLPSRERQRLLYSCLPHFARLGKSASLIVNVFPPKMLLPETAAFLEILQKNAGNVWAAELPPPPPEPLRLF